MTDRSYDAVTRDRFLHLERTSYLADGLPYSVTRIYWQRPDGSVVVTFKDSGNGNEWHVGQEVPTPTQLTAQPFPVLADAPRHSAEVSDDE